MLRYGGGPLLSRVELAPLYWGASWLNDSDLAALAKKLNEFFKTFVLGSTLERLREYSTPEFPIGLGTCGPPGFVTEPEPLPVTSDQEIQDLLLSYRNGDSDPSPEHSNRLYIVIMPPGIEVVFQAKKSCIEMCGYHTNIGNAIFYAVLPYPCPGCDGVRAALDALTIRASHEICEAITDPILSTGWTTEDGEEVADLCEGSVNQEGEYKIQAVWSNSLRACVRRTDH
jgi:hypothetical protein